MPLFSKTVAGVLSVSVIRDFLGSAMAANISSVTAEFRELADCHEIAKASLGQSLSECFPGY